jgi:hypothetical protein
VFDHIEASEFDLLDEGSKGRWFDDFEYNVDKGPVGWLINAVTNLYPEVSNDQLFYMLAPYMTAAETNIQNFFWEKCDCSDDMKQAHEWCLRLAKVMLKEAPGEQGAIDALFSLALVLDVSSFQDYCQLCIAKTVGKEVTLMSDFAEWGWQRQWIPGAGNMQ